MIFQYIIFFSILSTILCGIWFYTWTRLLKLIFVSGLSYKIVLYFCVISLILQLGRWFTMRLLNAPEFVTVITYVLFGLFIHLALTTLVKDLVLMIAGTYKFENYFNYSALVLAIIGNVYGAYVALSGPEIFKEKFNSKLNLQESLRIVQISDLHIGPIVKKQYVKDVVDKINEINPDLVFFTGDIGDSPATTAAEEIAELAKINPNIKKLYVLGNHEYYWPTDEWIKAFQSVGMEFLNNSDYRINREGKTISIAGIPDLQSERMDTPYKIDWNKVSQSSNGADYKILLAHQPKNIYKATENNFDLVFSGHTHNGQFFPFNFMVQWFNPYTNGLNKHNEKTMIYVNQGTGFWGPPLRLGVPGEITYFELY